MYESELYICNPPPPPTHTHTHKKNTSSPYTKIWPGKVPCTFHIKGTSPKYTRFNPKKWKPPGTPNIPTKPLIGFKQRHMYVYPWLSQGFNHLGLVKRYIMVLFYSVYPITKYPITPTIYQKYLSHRHCYWLSETGTQQLIQISW